ncbi:NAD(P)H-binding protein [Actinocatenispora rupis]|uniref:Nucleotide-diphosphate-sugar epimerase n=1 Tax=Actinocatenispora rupis TaxID=519421 RepID=A0A8J3J8V7_9ACTN|nr:NAD(P)H-binding protein [Actinocatenispora rupis]GID16118.1 nucleotide-diphosphate-sugar epimerase [Actinocatenispora rupis]
MIVVTGATGGVGREVVRRLAAVGRPVRALSRRPETLDVPAGVEIGRGDLADPATLTDAFAGADALFLYATFGDPRIPVEAAKAAGVRRIVLLSSIAVESAGPDNPIGDHHRAVESAIEESGLAWTHLRPGGFASNALWWAPEVREGVVRGAYPSASTAPIDPVDIAAVGVHALTEDGHAGTAYPLSGPEWLSQADQVRIIGEVLGRPVRYEQVSVEEALEVMARNIDARYARGALEIQKKLLDQPPVVLPTVEKVTGRPARTFAEWVAANADAFR